MCGKSLHDGEVGAGVESITNERAPEVMRREGVNLRATRESAQQIVNGLIGHAPYGDAPNLVHGHEQWPGNGPAKLDPAPEPLARARGCVRRRIAIAQNGASRSPISADADRTKRRIPITDFG
jgi:hypothetical protein